MAIFQGGWSSALSAALIGLDGSGRISAGMFPCDYECEGLSSCQELHRLFATVGFLAGVLAAVAWEIILKQHRSLQRCCFVLHLVGNSGAGVLAAYVLGQEPHAYARFF